MRLLVVIVAVLAAAACTRSAMNAPARSADAAAIPRQDAGGCQGDLSCPYGLECKVLGGLCTESACWGADPKSGKPAKACPSSHVCEYKDDQGIWHGNGFCFKKR